jgi:hypothetical protein
MGVPLGSVPHEYDISWVFLIGVHLLGVHLMDMMCLGTFKFFNLGFLGKVLTSCRVSSLSNSERSRIRHTRTDEPIHPFIYPCIHLPIYSP